MNDTSGFFRTDVEPIDAVHDEVASALGVPQSEISIEFFRRGGQNLLYKVLFAHFAQPAILKIGTVGDTDRPPAEVSCALLYKHFRRRRANADYLRRVQARRLPLPLSFGASAAILAHGVCGTGMKARPWVLIEELRGTTLDETPTTVGFQALGRTLANLHEVQFDNFVPCIRHPTDQIGWTRWLNAVLDAYGTCEIKRFVGTQVIDRLRSAGSRVNGTPVLCHGDVHPANVILRDGRASLIDWDEAGVALPERDLAQVSLRTIRGAGGQIVPDPVLFSAFLDGYRESGGDVSHEALKLHQALILLASFHVPGGRNASAMEHTRDYLIDLARNFA